jgi:hypothetical protein
LLPPLAGTALAGVLSANVFPDQTWKVLIRVEREYSGIVSRMTSIPSGQHRNVEEAKIHEAVFRDLIQSNKLTRPVFLRIDGTDPSDEFMARFASSVTPVNKASAAYFDPKILRGPIDRSTGKTGAILSTDSISWLFGDRVELKAILNCGHLCGEGGVYQIAKRRGRWTVDSYKNQFFY